MNLTITNHTLILISISIFLIYFSIVGYWWVYNRLKELDQRIRAAWASIDVQLKRRHSLIPSLNQLLTAYQIHETLVQQLIANLRSLDHIVTETSQRIAQEDYFSQQISQLMLHLETYPELKADAQFLELQEILRETEDQIAAARIIYNQNVKHYQTIQNLFPLSIVAYIHHFPKHGFHSEKPVA